MAEGRTPSKAELIERLRSTGQEVVTKLRALPGKTFEQGRYENGWNGRQILAHIASIEWTYPRLIDVARQGSSPEAVPQTSEVRRTNPGASSGLASRSARGGIDAYNARQVEKRANATIAELITEFETNRAATIAAVESTNEALLLAPIRSAGGITGLLAGVIHAVAVEHVMGHVSDITGEQWTGRRW